MPNWMKILIAIFLVAPAVPLKAQEWIYCPANPAERERQCQQAQKAIQTRQTMIATIGDQMHNPDIILARVDRKPDETVLQYKARTKLQQGVATRETNRWIPILGRYFDPDRQIIYVALDRKAYWQYVWEALAPDEAFARRTFNDREAISQQFKLKQFTGPAGQLAQWQHEIESSRLFQQQCCHPLPADDMETVNDRPELSPSP